MRLNSLLFWLGLSVAVLIALAILVSVIFSLNPSSFTSSSWFPITGSIALIRLDSELTTTPGTVWGERSAFDIVNQLQQTEKDPQISAILLEINSPGGSAVATRQIVDQIQEMDKPVISWISDVGASGAYYVAASTDYIMADPDSLTGSIGVISLLPDISGLLNDFNIEMNVIKQGSLKDIGSPFRPLTLEEKRIFQDIQLQMFNRFKSDVQLFRGSKLNLSAFDQIADGRILTGQQALDIGLIDELSSRRQAIEKAAALAGLSGTPELVDYSIESSNLANLFFQTGSQFGQGIQFGIQSVPSVLQANSSMPLLK